MITRTTLYTVLLGSIGSAALACDYPPLPVIPPPDDLSTRDKERVQEDVVKYFDGMRVYAGCVQAELAAAGNDAAPSSIKSVFVARNNAAVAEAQVVIKLYEPYSPKASPGTEEAIRRSIDELARGEPNYELMTPMMANITRQQLRTLQKTVTDLGAFESLTFMAVDPRSNADVYTAKFAEGSLIWSIKLTEDGKTEMSFVRPAAE
jgi:hypothetical protein